jgi:hypothetical protein
VVDLNRIRLSGVNVTYLGLSGMNKIPIPKIKGQIIPIPTTMRQDPEPGAERAAMEIQSEVEFIQQGL